MTSANGTPDVGERVGEGEGEREHEGEGEGEGEALAVLRTEMTHSGHPAIRASLAASR
jgi:hypothetical protein